MTNDDKKPDANPSVAPDDCTAHNPPDEGPTAIHELSQRLIRYMQDGFSVLDVNGVALDVNPALCNMTGFSREELIGVGPPHPYWPPEEYEHIQAALNETLKGDAGEFELIFMRKSGERFPVIVSPFAVKNRDGKTVSYSATVKDITERKQLHVALKESENRYRRIVETAEEGIWMIDEHQNTTYVNPKMARMLGYTVEDLQGRHFNSFLDDEGKAIAARNIERRKQGVVEQYDFRFIRKDGSVLWVLVSGCPIIREDGSYAGSLAMLTDITDRKRAEIGKGQDQKILELVARGGSLSEVLTRILLHYEEIYPGLRGSVLLLDPDGKHLRHGAAPNLPPAYCRAIDGAEIGPQAGSCGTAAYTGKIIMVADIARDPLWQNYKDLALAHGLQACWSVPIRGPADQVLGTFACYYDSPRTAEPSELSTIERGAHLAGMAIERDHAQAALQKSEERFRGLFESAGDAILILQGEQFIDCNDRALELFSCSSRDQIIGRAPFVLFPPVQPNGRESREFAIEKIAAVRSGQPQFFEWLHTKFDGTLISTEVSLSMPRRGDRSVIQAIIRDISERKKTEEALLEVNQKLVLHFEQTPMAVIEWDTNFCVTRWNPAAELIFGFSSGEARGRHASFIIPDECRHEVDEVCRALLSRAGGNRSTNDNLRKDGRTIHCEWYNTTLGDEQGRVTGVASLVMDITDRVKAEEALLALNRELEIRVAQRTAELEKANSELLRRNAQFRALAAKLSQTENAERRRIAQLLHDNYQQLLVAAKFKAEILQGSMYEPGVKEISRQVMEILNQSIEASRSLTMEIAPPILHDAGLAAGINWLARWLEEKHELKVTVSGAAPLKPIPTDVNILLFQAVRELLMNVIKHSGVKRAVVTMASADDGIQITVADEGRGFDTRQVFNMPRTFGLFNIQERLSLLNGRLEMISSPAGGTVITISAPLAYSVIPHAASVLADEGATMEADPLPRSHGRIRVLVADDHTVVREGLVQILRREKDLDVVGEAIDGMEAVEKARTLRPDVILMDVTMPRLNGLEATRRIVAEMPGTRIIGLSMHAKDEMQPQMLAAGASCYLAKNTLTEELITAIRDVMAVGENP